MDEFLKKLPKLAKKSSKETAAYFAKLKKKPPKQLDYAMQELHDQVFKKVDCLSCANCCKTTGPLFTRADIDRIAKHLKMKSAQFVTQYLKIDEDNDYVLQQVPCAFLGADNYCSIYDHRPKACSEFPHTNRKKFHQITAITQKNIPICPAAYQVVEAMKIKIKL